jgi:hypothetical protein
MPPDLNPISQHVPIHEPPEGGLREGREAVLVVASAWHTDPYA